MMSYLFHGLAALVPLIIGIVWYNPKVFGKIWSESIGLSDEDMKGANMPLIFGASFFLALLMTMPLSYMANHGGEEFDTFKHGAFHGMLSGVMLVSPILIISGLFERRNWKGMLVDVGYWILVMALMSGILGAWA